MFRDFLYEETTKLWITLYFGMTLYYVEYYWQCVVAKALPLPVGSETNTSLPCIDSAVSPPSVLLLNLCHLTLQLLSRLPLPFLSCAHGLSIINKNLLVIHFSRRVSSHVTVSVNFSTVGILAIKHNFSVSTI